MKESEFLKLKFKPYEIIQVEHSKLEKGYFEGILMAVDFEQKTMKILPIPGSKVVEEEHWAHCSHCKRPRMTVFRD